MLLVAIMVISTYDGKDGKDGINDVNYDDDDGDDDINNDNKPAPCTRTREQRKCCWKSRDTCCFPLLKTSGHLVDHNF